VTEIIIKQERLTEEKIEQLVSLCPFHALYEEKGELFLDREKCKMCRACLKSSDGALILQETGKTAVKKEEWNGIAVYAEQYGGQLLPSGPQLLTKAGELAKVTGHPIYAVLAGYQTEKAAETLLQYGADRVYVYDYAELKEFHVDTYTNALEDFIRKVQPSSVLVGGTVQGRSLAPKAAARFQTGLTADCTSLEMKENTDLRQIRPAFGGNIMAEIITPGTRPQFCTVRPGIFNAVCKKPANDARVIHMELAREQRKSRLELLEVTEKPKEIDISDAEIIVAVGKGVKSQSDLSVIEEFAEHIGAQIACTRPLVEKGWFGPKRQIGLSGRTVSAKVIITLGISGSVQFTAGMKGCDMIIAVNTDKTAPIFDIANYGVVADIYEILPRLMEKMKGDMPHVS